ncbi:MULTISPECIES: hypothetical protein [Methylorubrum]|uniref:HPt domain-containing protein n=1 Tax=Methylorubrum suomiense TaxID=144191 RepID=A0ABQ4V0T3_9HYPH|nr:MULTISPECIES: hypothetical protein [Methylobacteriaceae]GJE77318.1 hypothetical protein BGCPKDLD_3921 [Methylorubrum suomiense]
MKQNERALLQERVRTLVLRHALEAALQRVADLSGAMAEEDLIKLEHAVVGATRRVGEMPGDVRLATLIAVEDAVTVIRAAFDTVHQRIEAAPASALAA